MSELFKPDTPAIAAARRLRAKLEILLHQEEPSMTLRGSWDRGGDDGAETIEMSISYRELSVIYNGLHALITAHEEEK